MKGTKSSGSHLELWNLGSHMWLPKFQQDILGNLQAAQSLSGSFPWCDTYLCLFEVRFLVKNFWILLCIVFIIGAEIVLLDGGWIDGKRLEYYLVEVCSYDHNFGYFASYSGVQCADVRKKNFCSVWGDSESSQRKH